MGVVRRLVSNKTWGKNTRCRKYLLIADQYGFDRALEELELDRMHGNIPRSTYYRIRKKLYELKEKAEDGSAEYKDLFLNLLMFLASSGKVKYSREEIARELGVSVETIDGLKKWMEKNGLIKIVRLLLAGKKEVLSK